ncbi:MAG TPA: NAD(+) diphosphatase [Micromonosporaceae bacterium]|nr:NAD(+) diphosphatase [Micromonosporaceae bacterium]
MAAADPFRGRAVPPLARSTVDRAAHRRTDEEWLAVAFARARILVVDIVAGGRFLVQGSELVLLDGEHAPAGERLFLGEDSAGTPYFAVVAPLPDSTDRPGSMDRPDRPGGTAAPGDDTASVRAVTLREVAHLLTDAHAGLAVSAVALGHWHARYPYSPQTGRPTTSADGGWMRTDGGGEPLWPRTDPAVIVLVHDGVAGPDGRCLLGHAVAWTSGGRRRYSCLAGFVEAGESAEAAVVREVAEEVGVRVTGIQYVASQAWPFPASLMLGFLAYADPAQPLRLDPTEIEDARWFTRREIAAGLAGDAAGFALSTPASIASFLIATWHAGRG